MNWEKMRISTRTAKVGEELVEEALAGDVQQEKLLDWREVTHGSSQGCILRLILFYTFINNLNTKSQSKPTKSADGVKSGAITNSREFGLSFRNNRMFLSSEAIEVG